MAELVRPSFSQDANSKSSESSVATRDGKGEADGSGDGKGEVDGSGDGKGLGDGNGLETGNGSPTRLPLRNTSGLRFARKVDGMSRGARGLAGGRTFTSSILGNVPSGAPARGATPDSCTSLFDECRSRARLDGITGTVTSAQVIRQATNLERDEKRREGIEDLR